MCGMVLGSIALWIANPAFWLWVTSRLQGTQARMGPYVLMLTGVIATAILCAKGLGALDRRYNGSRAPTSSICISRGPADSEANTRSTCAP